MQRTLLIAALTLCCSAGMAQSATPGKSKAKPLSDAALDQVTAGTISAAVSNGVVRFQGQAPTANGLVSSTGSLAVQNAPIGGTTNMGSISLTGNAQQNLSSLVNLNAVNSKVNVLLNLNVNINSTVGTLTQSNLNGRH